MKNNKSVIFSSATFLFVAKWFLLAILVGVLAGSASAFFLVSLNWVTEWRETHPWIIWLLPIGGFIVGAAYYYWGQDVVKGNNQLIEEFHSPSQVIPLKMAPLVLFGTLVTHLFGGSAGREGTAVQMGGAIADQFTKLFRFSNDDRRILIIIGISAGFASVFGTPLAGSIFALEVLIVGRMRYEALLPSLLTALVADYTCHAWQIAHTHYSIPVVPAMHVDSLLWTLAVGGIFGLTAFAFSKTVHLWADFFKRSIAYPPLRPVVGGAILAVCILLLGTTRHIGLGIPTIVASFKEPLAHYDFVLKLLFTTFTLGAGFKGCEVTPLFFIGATLGNALVAFVPLPMALLAGMGFVSVFAGATNTPIACTLMGMELFGAECGIFIAPSSVVAYLFSGHSSIYSAQVFKKEKTEY